METLFKGVTEANRDFIPYLPHVLPTKEKGIILTRHLHAVQIVILCNALCCMIFQTSLETK